MKTMGDEGSTDNDVFRRGFFVGSCKHWQNYSTYSNQWLVILLVQLAFPLHAAALRSRDARYQKQQTGKDGSMKCWLCQCARRPFWDIPSLISSTGQAASRCHQVTPNNSISVPVAFCCCTHSGRLPVDGVLVSLYMDCYAILYIHPLLYSISVFGHR